MSKLAELAGTAGLRGKVCVTDVKGVTHEYADEAAATAVWDARVGSLEHRRGAFFETAAPPPPPPQAKKPSSSRVKAARPKKADADEKA